MSVKYTVEGSHHNHITDNKHQTLTQSNDNHSGSSFSEFIPIIQNFILQKNNVGEVCQGVGGYLYKTNLPKL